MRKKQRDNLIRIIIATALVVIATLITAFLSVHPLVKLALYLAPYLVVGYTVLVKAIKGIIRGRVLDENFLMAVATVGAFVLGAWRTGDYIEGVMVMLLYQTGEFFQAIATEKSRKNIIALMDFCPDYAVIENESGVERVTPDKVEVGSIIVIKAGEKVPLDAVIIEGESAINTSALTGESLPKAVGVGDEIPSGCVNESGLIRAKTTKVYGESTASKILSLISTASSKKSKAENFITKFSRIYTPVVCILALILAILPPVITKIAQGNADWGEWLYRALSFLVVSCPCALVISIPLAFFAGLGGASKNGILIKGSNYLETLSVVKTVAFDKTGTLTKGEFSVEKITAVNGREKELLYYCAHAESGSTHPLAKALIKHFGALTGKVEHAKQINGLGVRATVDGKEVAVGNEKFVKIAPDKATATTIFCSVNGEYLGKIEFVDQIKPTAKSAVVALKNCGVTKTVMLSGDETTVAEKVGQELGLDEIYSQLLPQEKVEKVEMLIARNNGSVAMVGDGLNDAPVLTRADIGIAMGALGTDGAIESADIVIMDDDPLKVSKAIKIAKKCLKIVRQNTVFSIGIKVACLIISALGLGNMMLAIFADVGVMVLAVLNSIRALKN